MHPAVPGGRTVPGPRRIGLPVAAGFLLLLLWAFSACAASTACPTHYYRGIAPDIANPKMRQGARELCFAGFGTVHSGLARTPLWSAERLTRGGLSAAGALVRVNRFHPEEGLPPRERAELGDYARSGFDRGHMAPNGDMPDEAAQYDSFSLANIVPQDPESNRGVWQKIESSVRALAKRRGELFVLTGPLFRGKTLSQVGGRVTVPSHLYKIVVDPGSGMAGAYLVENGPSQEYSTLSVKELEAIAGIDFFPGAPPSFKEEKMDLPKPSRGGSRGGKRPRKEDDLADALARGLRGLLR
jgi:endonuclease G